MMKVFRLFSLAVLIGLLSGCLPIFVGQTGLAIYDLKYESNHRDQGNTSYICSNKLTTLTFSFGYSDLNKINGWEAQLVGVFTGATLFKLVQTHDGGGFRVVDNRIVVDWVLVEGFKRAAIPIGGHEASPPASPPARRFWQGSRRRCRRKSG